MPFSAVVVARNEAANIERVVRAVKEVAAEVLVVDTGSTDDTCALATAAGARVLSTAWQGYGPTKNWAVAQAQHDWVFSLDADEEPTEQLLRSLQERLQTAQAGDVLGCRRITDFCGTWVRHGNWSKDDVWRVYHRAHNRWDERAVHEKLRREPSRSTLLTGELLHYSFPTEQHYLEKHRAYAALGAQALYREGRQATWTKRVLSPLWRAWRGYVLRGGWRDGQAGWRLAQLDYSHVREKYQILAKKYIDN